MITASCSLASVLSMYCCLLALLIFTLHRLCSRICIHFELKCTLQIYILFLYFLFVLRHCFHRVVCLCSILLDFLHPSLKKSHSQITSFSMCGCFKFLDGEYVLPRISPFFTSFFFLPDKMLVSHIALCRQEA